jgi:glycosyltransferase involved in cell wall biosynthesis
MSKPKVFLTGGDGMGWALDDDLNLVQNALENTANFTGLEDCEIVHSVWWEGLLALSREKLLGKRIICHVPAEPFRYMSLPRHRHAVGMVGCWITRSHQASDQFTRVGIPNRLIPYATNTETFRPLRRDDPQLISQRDQLGISEASYVIGNFHRDTEGQDLRRPKLVKGPDIFAEIVGTLWKRGHPIHVMLAGPRRHWLRNQLSRWGVPFTFVGQLCEGDDLEVNILPREKLNLLYNLLDLCLVTSRSEGGPQSIMEAAAAGCKIVSTRVGLAEDILEPTCIYMCPLNALGVIEKDIGKNALAATVNINRDRVLRTHNSKAVAPLFEDVYANIDATPRYHDKVRVRHKQSSAPKWIPVGFLRRLTRRARRGDFTAGIWHTFFKPPYGGGNQFMSALRKALSDLGVRVRQNEVRRGIDAYILNSIHFDVKHFLELSRRRTLNVVHRIDGPIHLIRGFDREKDQFCFDLNARFASATVVQSAWTYERIIEMGYRPVNPVIVHNAVDPDVFHRRGRVSFDPDRKVRLISTSWSDNPRKGGPFYKWIEDHLDWERFEYTFVGRTPERFDHIRHIPSVPSKQLANILRHHDIFVTASQNDPCSNALIEALACGLPALYLNDGGHPELAGYGGLPFDGKQDVLSQLDRLVENYEMFQNLIVIPTLDDVANRYLTLMREVAE